MTNRAYCFADMTAEQAADHCIKAAERATYETDGYAYTVNMSRVISNFAANELSRDDDPDFYAEVIAILEQKGAAQGFVVLRDEPFDGYTFEAATVEAYRQQVERKATQLPARDANTPAPLGFIQNPWDERRGAWITPARVVDTVRKNWFQRKNDEPNEVVCCNLVSQLAYREDAQALLAFMASDDEQPLFEWASVCQCADGQECDWCADVPL